APYNRRSEPIKPPEVSSWCQTIAVLRQGQTSLSASGARKCKFLCQEMKRFRLCKRRGAPICVTRIRWAVVRLPDKFGVRRVLLVFPHYAPSFGTLEFSYPLTDGMCANMPPQGLLVIAASLPACWGPRFAAETI